MDIHEGLESTLLVLQNRLQEKKVHPNLLLRLWLSWIYGYEAVHIKWQGKGSSPPVPIIWDLM